MARRVFRPNFDGYRELLASEPGVAALIAEEIAGVGAEVRDSVPERIQPYVLDGVVHTDRPQGNVTIAVKSAEALEGKYGYLSKAAGPLRQRPGG